VGDTAIEWTDKTWNPTVGCTRVSPGCKNCYAFKLHDMRHAAHQRGKKVAPQYAKPFTELQMIEGRLTDPLHWRKPQKIFVNSVSDLFHEDVPDEFIDKVFAVINATAHTLPTTMQSRRWHTYQILTKRAERMLAYMKSRSTKMWPIGAHPLFNAGRGEGGVLRGQGADLMNAGAVLLWPPCNAWLGVSVENQEQADKRIPLLLQTPAAVRFLSCEPLLGAIDLSRFHIGWFRCPDCGEARDPSTEHPLGTEVYCSLCENDDPLPIDGHHLHQVIVGGESGPHARLMHPAWAYSLRDQCQAANVAFFFKQWGEFVDRDEMKDGEEVRWESKPMTWLDSEGRRGPMSTLNSKDDVRVYRVGKKAAGRLLDGREWNEFPSVEVAKR
jgi:protein gp37